MANVKRRDGNDVSDEILQSTTKAREFRYCGKDGEIRVATKLRRAV